MPDRSQADRGGLAGLISAFEAGADAESMLGFVRVGWARLRRQRPDLNEAQRDAIAKRMRDIGMGRIWTGATPSDGVASFGGWIMPVQYRTDRGLIRLISGMHSGLVLFDYQRNPTALMPRSGGTPGRVRCDLIALDGSPTADLTGRIVLLAKPNIELVRSCFRAGAVGVLSDLRPHRPGVQEGPELDDATAWLNYAMPPWVEQRGFGVAITPWHGRLLRAALNSGRSKSRPISRRARCRLWCRW